MSYCTEIEIWKAQPLGNRQVSNVRLRIEQSLPEQSSLAKADAVFRSQAITIADALMDSLPGGTLDRLIAILLERKASHFVVPYFAKEK